MRTVIAAALLVAGASASAFGQEATDWSAVAQALGAQGSEQSGGVHKFSLPRADLQVTVDGVKIDPALSLGSWLAFKPMDDGAAMMMGDLVLTQKELNPVMARLAEGGIDIIAIHNHLIRAEPLPMYMHVHGQGDPVALAKAVRAALEQSATPLQSPQKAKEAGGDLDLDTAALDRIMGHAGKASGGVYKYSIPRAEAVTAHGVAIPPAMGTAIAIGFQPTGGGKAAINGDFVLTAEEVNPVLRALRENGIEVVALHNHMLEEQPRLFFMHFWANDDAQKLARGLKAALAEVNVAKS
jgi:hypothetical protein